MQNVPRYNPKRGLAAKRLVPPFTLLINKDINYHSWRDLPTGVILREKNKFSFFWFPASAVSKDVQCASGRRLPELGLCSLSLSQTTTCPYTYCLNPSVGFTGSLGSPNALISASSFKGPLKHNPWDGVHRHTGTWTHGPRGGSLCHKGSSC